MSQITSFCTCCGKEAAITELRCAPETEAYYRKLGTNLLHRTPTEHIGVDIETLVCPGCYKKLYFGGKKS